MLAIPSIHDFNIEVRLSGCELNSKQGRNMISEGAVS